MPGNKPFPFDDREIERLRAEGLSWRNIAAELHCHEATVRDYAGRKKLAVAHPPAAPIATPPQAERYLTCGWNVMPAFHAVSWGAIWAGLTSRP
jgi:transposase